MMQNIFDNSLIAFEGIDGTGKTTVTKMLVQKMNYISLTIRQSSKMDFSTREFLKRQLFEFIEPSSLEWLLTTLSLRWSNQI